MKNKIPKPDAKTIDVGIGMESSFSFDVNSVSKEKFESYINDCNKLGYNVNSRKTDDYYTASTSDGYAVTISYSEDKKTMSCHFRKN